MRKVPLTLGDHITLQRQKRAAVDRLEKRRKEDPLAKIREAFAALDLMLENLRESDMEILKLLEDTGARFFQSETAFLFTASTLEEARNRLTKVALSLNALASVNRIGDISAVIKHVRNLELIQ